MSLAEKSPENCYKLGEAWEQILLLEVSERTNVADTSDSRRLASRAMRQYISIALSHQVYYVSPAKLIQEDRKHSEPSNSSYNVCYDCLLLKRYIKPRNKRFLFRQNRSACGRYKTNVWTCMPVFEHVTLQIDCYED